MEEGGRAGQVASRGIGNRRARERDERAGPTIPDSDATRVREGQQINGEREMPLAISGKGRIWGDENPLEWRIIFQSGFVPFQSAGFRFAGFAWTSDFQADRHSGRSARGCRRNGFSISLAAISRFDVFCRQARAESRNPGFGEFSQTGRGGMFGLRTVGKRAFVSRRIGVIVPSRCRSLRFGDFGPAVCRRAAGT